MNSDKIYCPIIKGKLNDLKAVSLLTASTKELITPIVEFPPVRPSDSVENYTARFAKRIKENITTPSYIDFPLIREKTSFGESALGVAFGQLNALGIRFFPVFGFDRHEDSWACVTKQAERSGRLLLRLEMEDIEYGEDTLDRILEIQSGSQFPIDVMIDCRYIGRKDFVISETPGIADFIDSLATRIKVGRCIISGSSAPKTVTTVPVDGELAIERSELKLWAGLRTEKLPLNLIYSDYGVVHPDFSDQLMATHINGKIRYTEGAFINIFRGHSLRKGNKYEQYRDLSRRVIRSQVYLGMNYSHGDRYIYDCAAGSVGTGNPGTWVFVDQNHHISHATQQISHLNQLASRGATSAELIAEA